MVVGILSKFLKSKCVPLKIAEVNNPGLNSNLILLKRLSSFLLLRTFNNFLYNLSTISLKIFLFPHKELFSEKKLFIRFFKSLVSNFPVFNCCKKNNFWFLKHILHIKDK